MSIIVENLTHIYSKKSPFERVALDNISLEIQDGEFVGLIGHTGSGKSTFIQHLNGLLKPDSGRIIINDTDILSHECDMKKLRSEVGLVFQYPEYQLFEETVFEDIAYGPKNLGLSETEIKKRVFDAIEFVGLDPNLLNVSPFELSGGQKRKVAIAGVVAMEPKVLILDEPTAGLDPFARNELLARLKNLQQQRKITVILVSHSMEDVANTVDKVIVMAKGTIACKGSVADVFKQSELLKSIGLDVPQICDVLGYLRAKGMKIDEKIYNVEQAADAIFAILKE